MLANTKKEKHVENQNSSFGLNYINFNLCSSCLFLFFFAIKAKFMVGSIKQTYVIGGICLIAAHICDKSGDVLMQPAVQRTVTIVACSIALGCGIKGGKVAIEKIVTALPPTFKGVGSILKSIAKK